MLSKKDDTMYVCEEETIEDIRARYMIYNHHAESYTWKRLSGDDFVTLNMTSTLAENGMVDESEEFYELGINEDAYLTTLHIYFNDDLTYA